MRYTNRSLVRTSVNIPFVAQHREQNGLYLRGRIETGDIYSMVLQRVEKPIITLVLKKAEGNHVSAARLLGNNRNTLRNNQGTGALPSHLILVSYHYIIQGNHSA